MTDKRASRLAWTIWVASMVLVVTTVGLLVENGFALPEGSFGVPGFSAIIGLTFSTVGALVASRRKGNPIGWIFCALGLAASLQEFAQQYATYAFFFADRKLPAAELAAWFPSWVWVPATGMATTFVFLLFPDGRLLSRRWKLVMWLGIFGIFTGSASFAFTPGPLENFRQIDNPLGVDGITFISGQIGLGVYGLAAILSSACLVLRYRRSQGDERLQLKWFATAAVFVALSLAVTSVFAEKAPKSLELVVVLSFLSLPIAAGIAILRHRLFEIDVVINKAVVYGLLLVAIVGVYAGLVVGVSALVNAGTGQSLPLSIAAATIIAIAFDPARKRIQRFADRIVYGHRLSPYQAMAELSQLFSSLMTGELTVRESLGPMAESLAKGLSTARTKVRVILGSGEELALTFPADAPDEFDKVMAVRDGQHTIGEISVSKKPGESFSPSDEDLLQDLVRQCELAFRNLRLTAELQERLAQISAQAKEIQASRQRIVTAQDGERRRIERDIHDGAQQQLVSMTVKLAMAKTMLSKDVVKADGLLDQLKLEVADAVETLRDLARGVFPRVLADEGLCPALRAHIAKMQIDATVLGDDQARFDPEVEANVFFSVREALQNASKHAGGAAVVVRIDTARSELVFSVEDRGPGFDPRVVKRGSGLQNMSDRIEALGGTMKLVSAPGAGTSIEARIPAKALQTH